MTNRDFILLSILLALGAFIWGRDVAWLSSSDEALPILAAIPLFVWLGAPWKWQKEERSPAQRPLTLACAGTVAGILLDWTVLLALGWTLLLWAWLSARLEPRHLPRVKRLLVLPLLAFPWISLDLQQVGWWFRLSGAFGTEQLFRWGGYEVAREGTNLLIAGRPIAVEAACSGMQTLQSMLIAGVFAAHAILGNSSRYWTNLLVLAPLAWLANTLRIVVLSLATIWVSPEFAQGAFHDWGGLAVLLLMFALCCAWFQWQKKNDGRPVSAPRPAGGLAPAALKA